MFGWPADLTKSAWLDRFMIDARFQGKDYAKRFLKLLIQEMHHRYSCENIFLSIHPKNNFAQSLYEALGFYLNGEVDDAGPVFGIVMELILNQ
ncbi:RimJ/RimL family protein N-acetyltransferase [Cytobacillus purgationiresistens]|uniref:RimJ/RimL family protein N-acetyltransferase n=1 Tax=Cytobacillus purgationiresistens TaxID=863449 RepID=A0ABU0AB45_9BACI|nr:RimJ/RimL family protein N-acetyltransferase [Cytobacillus purgationiresistens]